MENGARAKYPSGAATRRCGADALPGTHRPLPPVFHDPVYADRANNARMLVYYLCNTRIAPDAFPSDIFYGLRYFILINVFVILSTK